MPKEHLPKLGSVKLLKSSLAFKSSSVSEKGYVPVFSFLICKFWIAISTTFCLLGTLNSSALLVENPYASFDASSLSKELNVTLWPI